METRLGNYIHEYSVRNKLDEDIPVYSVTNSQGFCKDYFGKEVASKNKTSYKIVPKGYFAYNPSRINVGSVDWQRNEERVIVSPLYNVFYVDSEINHQYLFYFLKSNFALQNIKAVATGSVRDNLKFEMLKEFQIKLLPLEEQNEIVEKLDLITKIIEEYKTELYKYDELIKARFIEMFGSIHNSKIFVYYPLKEITTVCSGGTPNRDNKAYWESGTIPWVKTTELKNNRLTHVEEFITELGLEESSAKLVPSDTVLVAMYGQGKTRGMTGYLEIEATTNQACACILPTNKMNMIYLWKYFELSYDKLRELAKGGNQPNLNCTMIRDFNILVPPIELQNQYADFVRQVDKSREDIKKALEKTQQLYDSLMQEYFG